VPISSRPGCLQAFANNQPVTYVINAMRALALGHIPVTANLLKSIVSLAAIFAVFAPLAVRAYKPASQAGKRGACGPYTPTTRALPGGARRPAAPAQARGS